MHLQVTHTTTYWFDEPVRFGLQQLRLTPTTDPTQTVLSWETEIIGGSKEVTFADHHNNQVDLVSFGADQPSLTITSHGVAETMDTSGVLSDRPPLMPLWFFRRDTPLTRPGVGVAELIGETAGAAPDLGLLHELSARIRDRIAYTTGATSTASNAEDAIAAGRGVCQDHTHVFLAAVRQLRFPARYVSGYLFMEDTEMQEATHAWAEVFVESLGWVGFDVSNGIAPDEKYIRVATGLDYRDAAPVRGLRYGDGLEQLTVSVHVQAQQ